MSENRFNEKVPKMVSEAIERELTHLYESPLIVSDSQRSYNSVRNAVQQQFVPRDVLEHMLVAEIVDGEWEALRLRRFKTMIVTAARRPALRNLLTVLLGSSNSDEISELTDRFFTNKAVRRKVDKFLRSYGLTEANIDAEAFRRSIGDLGEINRRLTELASRRDKTLQLLEDHRAGLATPSPLHTGEED